VRNDLVESDRPAAAVFFFRLPFDLPVDPGSKLVDSGHDDGSLFVEITIERIQISLADAALDPYEAGLAVLLGREKPDLSQGSSSQTWAVASTPYGVRRSGRMPATSADLLTFLFERSLASLNSLIRASALVSRHTSLHVLSKESLDPKICIGRFDSWDSAVADTSYRFTLHSKPYNPRFATVPPGTADRIKECFDLRRAELSCGIAHPFRAARELSQRAASMRLAGHSTSSIVVLQSSLETFLRGLHRMAQIDLHSAPQEVAFETLLKSTLPSAFGGDWASEKSAVTVYRRDLYALRNRVVHGGHDVEWEQVAPAFDCAHLLNEFVVETVGRQWKQFPLTTLAITDKAAGGTCGLSKTARRALATRQVGAYWAPGRVGAT
jgi:hypothetical protein